MFEVSLLGAFVAGLLSFLSPCVLPLVPGYIGFLAGRSIGELAAEASSVAARRAVPPALCFVAGFGTIFVLFGATATSLGWLLSAHADWLAKVAGVLIVLFGLHVMGLFRLAGLYREWRFHPQGRPAGVLGAFAIGLAFGFGWTPCVGPVLASVLMVAGTAESAGSGVLLLTSYGAGMGLPFLAAAAAIGPFHAFFSKHRNLVRWSELALGGLLVATGLAILFDLMNEIGFWLLEAVPWFGRIG
jgi:cytochrome c-type biogenesis protein